jgi:hypothetical protein
MQEKNPTGRGVHYFNFIADYSSAGSGVFPSASHFK